MPEPFDYEKEVQTKEVELGDLEIELAGLLEEVKERKAHIKVVSHKLRALIRGGESAVREQQPLFEEPKTKTNAWRDLPISAAISVVAVLRGFEEQHGITTLGKAQDWLNTDWDARFKGYSALKGVGEEKAAQASDQMDEFWKAHPEYCTTEEAEEAITDVPTEAEKAAESPTDDDQEAFKQEVADELIPMNGTKRKKAAKG